MGKDWLRWHEGYDEPTSSLARRLAVVQDYLRHALVEVTAGPGGQLRLISMCAGDGRDVLPVLAERHGAGSFRSLLVELDPELAGRATARANELGLSRIEVRSGDAGLSDPYVAIAPAHLVLTCGVFGNISLADARRTIAALPSLLVDGGIVIWTRGRADDGTDPSWALREAFAAQGFGELSFTAPADARFRVGMHQLATRPHMPPLRPGIRMFTFV
jgi:hypothetical protein